MGPNRKHILNLEGMRWKAIRAEVVAMLTELVPEPVKEEPVEEQAQLTA